MKDKRGAWALVLTLFLTACTKGILVHSYQPTGEEGWARNDTFCFQLPASPQTGDYPVWLGLRYGNDFPYEGIWIEAKAKFIEPAAMRCDTLYFKLTGPDGHSLGQGISLQQHEMLLGTYHLTKGQQGTIYLRHIMAREIVPAISNVGLKVETPQ